LLLESFEKVSDFSVSEWSEEKLWFNMLASASGLDS
jgi:hypothetical protein